MIGHRPADEPGGSEDLAGLDRVLSLTDQVLGLQAELAEERYRNSLARQAAVDREEELARSLRSTQARLDEVLQSRSWRYGHNVIRLAGRAGRLLRRQA